MKKKHLFVVGAIIAIIALFGFGKVDAKADMEVVTDWFSEPHSEYFVYADCVEETNVTGSTEHYVYERYLWHDGKTWRATGVKLVPSDYSFNKLVTSGDYSGAGKNTKKYNIWRSQEYDYAVSEASNGGYNVVDSNGNAFHAWSYYTVTVSAGSTQYRYRYSRTHNEYVTYLNGCYHIRTVPGWTFDVAGWGTESGTNLIIWEFSGQANQTFRFSLQNDGSYIITDQNSGLCMDVDGDTVDGTNICMKTYNGGTSQRWYVGANSDGTYSLVSALFRVFVADVAWGEDNKNGSNVFLWQWHGGQNQRFYLEKVDTSTTITPVEPDNSRDDTNNNSSGISHGGGGISLEKPESESTWDDSTTGSFGEKVEDGTTIYEENQLGEIGGVLFNKCLIAASEYIGLETDSLKTNWEEYDYESLRKIRDVCIWGAENKIWDVSLYVAAVKEYVIEQAYMWLDKVEEQKRKGALDELVERLEGKFFTYSGKECSECKGEFVSGHGCWNCSATHIVDGSCKWFNKLFPELGQVKNGHFPRIANNLSKGSSDYTGQSCFGFGAFAQWYVYTKTYGEHNLKGQPYFASGKLTYELLKDNKAQAGDVIRKGGHTMVIYSYDENGIVVVDCNAKAKVNGKKNCIVRKRTIGYAKDSDCAISRPVKPVS